MSCGQVEPLVEEEIKRDDVIVERDVSVNDSGYVIPENDGVRNVLLNADWITECEYVTVNDLNALRYYVVNSTIKGIVYSSSRYEDLMCPNNVSLWTYLTSLRDPASYMHTVDLSLPPYNLRGFAKTFYGQSCSSLVRYSLGIKHSFQIHQMTVWPDFDKVFPNEVNALRLGDMLTSEKKTHTRLVTGLKVESGNIVSVVISEGTSPVAIKREFSAETVQRTLDEDGYQIFRYRYISSVKHPPFKYDYVNEDENLNQLVLMPKRGDRANWRKDENVIIDVLNQNNYTGYKVYKDGTSFSESALSSDVKEINFGVLPIGDYKMVLTSDTSESVPVYWMVVDYNVNVETVGSGKVNVMFSSSNATPIYLTWRRPWSFDISNNDMPLWTTVIDEKAQENGIVESELDSYTIKKYGLGYWDFRVAFETKYGIIGSDNVSVNVK